MAKQLFLQLPWLGGLNTSLDESMIGANQLTVADNLVFDTRGSRRKREGIDHDWDSGSDAAAALVGLHDFWYGTSSKTQRILSVSNARAVYSYSGGTRTTLTVAGTAWSGTLTSCSIITFNNLAIIAISGSGNVLKKYSGSGDVEDLDGTPPAASILREHHGRIWCNDKTNLDRLHFSPVHDHTKWNGSGDSGAIDIGVGDGDPEGITAIFPTFKGDLFVAKKTKLYRISGYSPETYQVSLVSSGIGCVSHNSIAAIDQDDMMFVSERGIHSLVATANYGDFASNFVSADIQKTFNDDLSRSRLKFSVGAYNPQINSVAFAVSGSGASTNDRVYLYHLPSKSWYRWPSISCESMIVASDTDQKRFYFGTSTTRVSKSFTGANYDVSSSGTNTAISFQITTGYIAPDNNPYSMKAFKRFILYYKPAGNHTIAVNMHVDNMSLSSENSLTFSETAGTDLLGSTFILGASILGYSVVMGPYSKMVDGIGRGFKLDITQTGTNQEVEIQGFGIEFEPAGEAADVILR
jgi:hypothetical protein